MRRLFNIAGPCVPGRHYMLPPLERVRNLDRLLENEEYFVIHAPRQSGKTTLLQTLAGEINRCGERLALYASLERAQGITEREKAIPTIIRLIGDPAVGREEFSLDDQGIETYARMDPNIALTRFLRDWSRRLPRPLVLLLDEVDCLTDDVVISFLRQLRDGYVNRATHPFPASIALVGMRNLRDYQVRIRPESESLGTASPFNIIADALTIRNFTREEIASLYAQHTQETGQAFEAAAIDRVDEKTSGQPWLVNALARLCVDDLAPERDHPVTADHIEQATETLILKRPTHLDSLMERLREARVQRVIEPILYGDGLRVAPDDDDYLYVSDLGLIQDEDGTTEISNAIYREVIPRFLNAITQQESELPGLGAFATPEGGVDMPVLLRTFQQFWRENSEIWLERYTYREAGPHLVLQAYLQRIFNGGGALQREYAAGTGRVDLCVQRGPYRYALELKTVRPRQSLEKVQSEGLDQVWKYLERLGLNEGYLLIFDQRPGLSWEERIYEKRVEHKGRWITILGA